MKLVTIAAGTSGSTGALVGEDVLEFGLARPVIPIAALVPPSMRALLAAGPAGLDMARGIVDRVRNANRSELEALRETGALKARTDVRLLAPVPRPSMVLSHGRAYASHRAEMRKGEDVPSGETPTAFIKNTNAVIGPDAPIVLPPQCPDMVDIEVEFSVVFGAVCHNVSEADALDYIAGYTMVNDVSARDWVQVSRRAKWQGDLDQNRMGKQLPTFCPLGPVIATKDEVPDPDNVDVTSAINGNVMQSSNTSDLIWRIPFLIAYFSRWYSFSPGDVLTTGSPAGAGFARDPKIFVKAGDIVTVGASGVGTLSNPIVNAS